MERKSSVNEGRTMKEKELETIWDSQKEQLRLEPDLDLNLNRMKQILAPEHSFDIVYRVVEIGEKNACIVFVDGFCKDELMQKILQYLMDLKAEDMPEVMHGISKKLIPYVEVDLGKTWDQLIQSLLSGQFLILIDGYDTGLLIDSRTYPARDVSEPEKEKSLRGSKDGFVETI
ncbi:MAG: spore germination protein, partial [Lachnospiraceae bacterium]